MRINVKNWSIVKPISETPRGAIWLSNVDLVMPASYHTHLLYFYRSKGAADLFDTAALGRALVEFYPHAGRLNKREYNRMEIICNAEGVLFVEAECDAAVDDFGGDFAPKAEHRLIPAVDYSRGLSTFPLLLLQNWSMVKPISETPRGAIWLSNVDLVMPASYHTHLLYFYRSNGAANFFDTAALKAALGRALIELYPHAGRLNKREDNRMEIICNAEEVLFVEAECDAAVDDFGGDFAPRRSTASSPPWIILEDCQRFY